MKLLQKTMNGQQRKMLDTIYTDIMNQNITDYKTKRRDGKKALIQEILKTTTKKYSAKIKQLEKALTEYRNILKEVKKEGISSSMNFSRVEFTLNMYGDNKQLKEFEKTTNIEQTKLKDLKNEIRADIYGLDISYTKIRPELDKKIKALNLA